ncbi:GNAT family N-acetyltransferase [Crenobacter sp. SG2305]|uniref:GNAT family N-acetyltransferase n=1 Tax=Crenobacter oryzisoli TaxID=3056844 RepID=UPI0025AAB097|nr:GNAT family N-acetyltransferase [Crenobacter sp. SG2305]MDN0081347.1 GNAT family N-acetyltransferase [Crenobacter sp. SG2305]
MSVAIRELDKANPADQVLLVDLVDAYARDPMGGGEGLSADAHARLGAAFAAHPSTFALIAEQDGEPLGIALCVLGFSSFAAAPTVNLHDVAVLPAARGQGVGRRLMDAVAAAARERGACKVTLEVRPDNQVGRGLYESLGYRLSALGGQAYLMMEKKL